MSKKRSIITAISVFLMVCFTSFFIYQPALAKSQRTLSYGTNQISQLLGDKEQQSLIESVYWDKSKQNIINKEIEHSLLENISQPPDKQLLQSSGVFMGHIIPLEEGVTDENDLNLIDTDIAVNQNQENIAANVNNLAKGVFPLQNKAGNYIVGFSRQTGSDLFRFSLHKTSLTLSPISAAIVYGNVQKNSITYEEIYPATDLHYTVEPFRLKEELIVKKYTEQSDFFFHLGIENADYEIMPDSTILFSDSATGQPLFYMPKCFAVDNEGNYCNSVQMMFSQEDILQVTVDANWLRNAEYPITIDPTINLFDAAFTRSSMAYKQDGTQVVSGTPRYESGRFNEGIMIEEGTTNIYSNPSFETGSMANWVTWKYGGTGTIQAITGAARSGRYGCQLTGGNNGSFICKWSSPDQLYYSQSYYVKRQDGAALQSTDVMAVLNNVLAAFDSITAVGDGWYLCKKENTQHTVQIASWGVYVRPNLTIYVDQCQVELKPYCTSYIDTTRSSESLTIPTTGVLNPSQGTIEEWAYIDPNGVHSAKNSNWSIPFSVVTIQSSPYAELNQISIRRVPSTTSWEAVFSNSSGICGAVSLGNITTPGWYCFGVKWEQEAGGFAYLNGVLKGSVSPSYLPSEFNPTANIGSWTSSCLFDHIIDDFRISSIARTDADIQTAYQSNQPLIVDASTTCKLNFDGNLDAVIVGPIFVKFIYDNNNRLDYMELPSGTVINYQYDANGNLIERQ